ncbi:MAG: YdeI/OmpD-associated family protein [Pseudomonadota bacterium]
MARAAEDAQILTVRSRGELRAWLAGNHAGPGPVWLATYKKHHPDYLAYEPQVEELLSWGWIDSVTRALDADRSMILIAPRNPRSAWSAINKAHVERAIASGAMTPAGLARVEAAKANGMWTFLDEVERLEVPPDLAAALAERDALPAWDAYPRSVKRGALEWLRMARTSGTRTARIADIAGSAAEGRRPSPFRR